MRTILGFSTVLEVGGEMFWENVMMDGSSDML